MKRFSKGLRIVAGALLLPVAACGVRSSAELPATPEVTPTRAAVGPQPSKEYRSDCLCLEEALGKRPLSVDGAGRFLKPASLIDVGAGETDAQTYHIAKISVIDTPSEHHADDYF